MKHGVEETVMAVSELQLSYKQNDQFTTVLNDLQLSIAKGEIVSLLGESGSGKSSLAKALMGLLPPNTLVSGTLRAGDLPSIELAGKPNWGRIRGRLIGMLFQDARLALNPLVTIKAHFVESLVFHGMADAKGAAQIGADMLGMLGFDLPNDVLESYPFELSGGMCQRVCLALTLSLKPQVLIADEPTSALDTASQKEVLDLIRQCRDLLGLSVLFITHDIGVAGAISDRIIVLSEGTIVEDGAASQVLRAPAAGYTKRLLTARDSISVTGRADRSNLPVLEVRGLEKSFQQPVLRDVDMILRQGGIMGILGQSGSGKSTLVRCIAGLETPDSGRVILSGEDITGFKGKARRKHCKELQLIFQDARASLNASRTALRLVQEPLGYLGIGTRKEREAKARQYLDEVGITGDMQQRKPPQLSTGQCQRIAIARALVLEPKVLLCDEPVSALDMSVQAQILSLLQRLHKQFGFAILMISHDMRVLRTFCHEIAVMDEGRFSEIRAANSLHESELAHTKRLAAVRG